MSSYAEVYKKLKGMIFDELDLIVEPDKHDLDDAMRIMGKYTESYPFHGLWKDPYGTYDFVGDDEDTIEIVADWLDDTYATTTVTGSYDRDEDERYGTVDYYTGKYYLSVDP